MQSQNEVILVRPEGAFDFETAARLKAQWPRLLSLTGHVVLDLRAARLDCRALSALLSLQRRLELQGRILVVVTEDSRFLALLERTGAESALCLFRDVDAAVRYAKTRPSLAMAA